MTERKEINDDLLLKLKKDIFHRAKLFIDNIGEFAPFGSELNGEEIKPVMIYDDSEEIIEATKLIDVLKNKFCNKLSENNIQAGAIAYDVFINVKSVKRNALCLIISTDGSNWSEDYYPYKVIDGECVWG
jgi:hypothetical protein